jgi:hypothetical protein
MAQIVYNPFLDHVLSVVLDQLLLDLALVIK